MAQLHNFTLQSVHNWVVRHLSSILHAVCQIVWGLINLTTQFLENTSQRRCDHTKSIIHKGAPLHACIPYAPSACDMLWSARDSLMQTLAQLLAVIWNEARLICSQTPVRALLAQIAYLWKWNPGLWVAAQKDRVSPRGSYFTVTPSRITRCPSLGHMRLESLNTPGYSLPQLAGVFICLLEWYSANQAIWGMVVLLDFFRHLHMPI